jgi:aspartate/methionine/tyrosine aminotransferase
MQTPEFQVFELERWQSLWEQRVEINLADSGVAPLALQELLDRAGATDLGGVSLHYPEVNGTLALRERIAALYRGVDADNVLVTVGGSEANAILADTLLRPGDRVTVMEPGYLQVAGLARNRGCLVTPLRLDPDDDWRLDLVSLQSAVEPNTRLVSLTTPNNPTGAVLNRVEIEAVVEVCERSKTWLHVDEVYRGSELDGMESASLFGITPKTVVVGSLSKAYGLAGLRIGWLVAPHDLIADLWRRHEYAAISASSLAMHLAKLALSEPTRGWLLGRQRSLAASGLRVVEDWVARHTEHVSLVRPRATALACIRYAARQPSVEVAEQIRQRASVLVGPGAYLGAEGHLRVAHALQPQRTADALERIADVLRALN